MNETTDFDGFLSQAWADHAGDPAGVAERIAGSGPGLIAAAANVAPLAQLAHHVYGEHLGQWAAGRALLERLAAHPLADANGSAAARRCQASLDLCAGQVDLPAALPPSDRIRIQALAAANLAERDTPRAAALFEQALAEAAACGLPDTDPMNRGLAACGNNLAATLEERPQRSAAERELMIRAAQAARHYWAIAGTWLETERAEYRLAKTWVQAGDPAQARHHAQQCLDIVQAQGNPALERFFGLEALALAQRAAGDATACADTLTNMHATFDALDESDKAWCRPTLATCAA